jgi:phage terminase large subunit-like protein
VSLIRGHRSPAERLAALPARERKHAMNRLGDDEIEALLFDWKFWARPEQLPPAGDWTTWAVFAGRGTGKTRMAAEFVRDEIESGRSKYPIFIGADAEDVRKVMVTGESGMLSICPPWFTPTYEPSVKQLTFPNGVVAHLFGAHEPDKLRGPQSDLIWADEIAKWQYPTEAYDNAVFGNRLGNHPRRVVTSTPRPITLVRLLMGRDSSQKGAEPDTSVVLNPAMATYDNFANLAPSFIKELLKKYQGTRLGRQELMGELLLDIPGALWTLDMIEKDRVQPHQAPTADDIKRIVVAIDPAVTSGETSNETGIIAACVTWNDHYYVLADDSGRWKATGDDGWAARAVNRLRMLGGDRIIGEVNNGGDLVEATIRIYDQNVPYKAVHASRGKRKRGEPIASLYEQHRVHHVGTFSNLEDQQITWVPGGGDESPDRSDALIWALTELAGEDNMGMLNYMRAEQADAKKAEEKE